ncbi:MAG: FAD-dependent monooxygenase, partial [Solimonas sp.]
HLHSIGQQLGFSYQSGAVVPDGTAPVPVNPRTYVPSDRPGSRFPHYWLDPERTRSTLEWFDTDFTLVTSPLGTPWLEAVRDHAARSDIRIVPRVLDGHHFSDSLQMGLKGAVLVRPDGHVAWRIPYAPSDPLRELSAAVEELLA